MRKTLTVLALTAALTGGTTTVALAADAPATAPHRTAPDQPVRRRRRQQQRAVGQDRPVGPARAARLGRPGQAQGRQHQRHQHPLSGTNHNTPRAGHSCSCSSATAWVASAHYWCPRW